MNRPTNNEIGKAWTAYILGELFESWPATLNFNILDTSQATGVAPAEDEEIEFFISLTDWLRDNGYISFEQSSENQVYNVALTEKGFAILDEKPIGTERSLGTRMKEAATTAGKDAGRAVIASLVGAMVSTAVTALKS